MAELARRAIRTMHITLFCQSFDRRHQGGDSAYPSGKSDWLHRRKRCRKALSPYLDQRLTCVLIGLPGGHYTIESDAQLERAIYWDWHPIRSFVRASDD